MNDTNQSDNTIPKDHSTPAPVAVPKGGWRDGDQAVTLRRGRLSRWTYNEYTNFWNEQDGPGGGKGYEMDGLIEKGHVLYVHAPRPNPASGHATSGATALLDLIVTATATWTRQGAYVDYLADSLLADGYRLPDLDGRDQHHALVRLMTDEAPQQWSGKGRWADFLAPLLHERGCRRAADAVKSSDHPAPDIALVGHPDEVERDTVRVPRKVAEYAAAYIGEADHQEALDVASAIEDALAGRPVEDPFVRGGTQ